MLSSQSKTKDRGVGREGGRYPQAKRDLFFLQHLQSIRENLLRSQKCSAPEKHLNLVLSG